jgi:hypothetical protein
MCTPWSPSSLSLTARARMSAPFPSSSLASPSRSRTAGQIQSGSGISCPFSQTENL